MTATPILEKFKELCPFEAIPRNNNSYDFILEEVEYVSPFFPQGGSPHAAPPQPTKQFQTYDITFKPNQTDKFIVESLVTCLYTKFHEYAKKICTVKKVLHDLKVMHDLNILFENLPSSSSRGSTALVDSSPFSKFIQSLEYRTNFFQRAVPEKYFSRTCFEDGARLISYPLKTNLFLFYDVNNFVIAEPEISEDKTRAKIFYDISSSSLCNLYDAST